jgi:hypothetical protein
MRFEMKIHIGPYRKNRRINVRIDKYDTWNMNSTLAYIILPMLKQLKETQHGSALMPAFEQTSTSSVQYCLPFYGDGDNDAWEEGHKQWQEVLDKMIWSFEQINTDWESQFESGTTDFYFEKNTDTDYIKMKHGPNNTYKFDTEGAIKYQERIQEGLELFGKYYQDLWD